MRRFLIIVSLFCAVAMAHAQAPTEQQQGACTSIIVGTSLTCTFSSTPGNPDVAFITLWGSFAAPSSITDGCSSLAGWNLLNQDNVASSRQAIYYAVNLEHSSSCTVTLTWSSPQANQAAAYAEYSSGSSYPLEISGPLFAGSSGSIKIGNSEPNSTLVVFGSSSLDTTTMAATPLTSHAAIPCSGIGCTGGFQVMDAAVASGQHVVGVSTSPTNTATVFFPVVLRAALPAIGALQSKRCTLGSVTSVPCALDLPFTTGDQYNFVWSTSDAGTLPTLTNSASNPCKYMPGGVNTPGIQQAGYCVNASDATYTLTLNTTADGEVILSEVRGLSSTAPFAWGIGNNLDIGGPAHTVVNSTPAYVTRPGTYYAWSPYGSANNPTITPGAGFNQIVSADGSIDIRAVFDSLFTATGISSISNVITLGTAETDNFLGLYIFSVAADTGPKVEQTSYAGTAGGTVTVTMRHASTIGNQFALCNANNGATPSTPVSTPSLTWTLQQSGSNWGLWTAPITSAATYVITQTGAAAVANVAEITGVTGFGTSNANTDTSGATTISTGSISTNSQGLQLSCGITVGDADHSQIRPLDSTYGILQNDGEDSIGVTMMVKPVLNAGAALGLSYTMIGGQAYSAAAITNFESVPFILGAAAGGNTATGGNTSQ